MKLLDGFKGYLQIDSHGVYDSVWQNKDIIHLNCLTHTRKEVNKALSNDQLRAEKALLFIQALYKVERKQ